jgi:hypothetical protein
MAAHDESEFTVGEIERFLVDEAALLDEWRLDDWLALIAPDGSYLTISVERPPDHIVRDPRLAQIAADRQKRLSGLLAQLAGGALQPLLLNVADDEPRALLGEPTRNHPPEPLRPS